jgi:hypothetical protein
MTHQVIPHARALRPEAAAAETPASFPRSRTDGAGRANAVALAVALRYVAGRSLPIRRGGDTFGEHD